MMAWAYSKTVSSTSRWSVWTLVLAHSCIWVLHGNYWWLSSVSGCACWNIHLVNIIIHCARHTDAFITVQVSKMVISPWKLCCLCLWIRRRPLDTHVFQTERSNSIMCGFLRNAIFHGNLVTWLLLQAVNVAMVTHWRFMHLWLIILRGAVLGLWLLCQLFVVSSWFWLLRRIS